MTRKGKNLMEMIPVRSDKVSLEERADGKINIIIYRNSLIERIVRKLFKSPEKVTIELDQLGSRVFQLCDGRRNIYEISRIIDREFGERARPLEARLITFIKILVNNKFVILKERGE